MPRIQSSPSLIMPYYDTSISIKPIELTPEKDMKSKTIKKSDRHEKKENVPVRDGATSLSKDTKATSKLHSHYSTHVKTKSLSCSHFYSAILALTSNTNDFMS